MVLSFHIVGGIGSETDQ